MCELGKSLGCNGLKADGICGVYSPEGVAHRVNSGECIFKNIRAPKIGIYAPKGVKGRNPLKQAKMEARAGAAIQS